MAEKPSYEELEKRIQLLEHLNFDHKQSEMVLNGPEKKWRNILANTSQIGICLDPRARIVFANHTFLDLTGWKAHEVIGRNWFEMFIPQHLREKVRQVFQSIVSQNTPLEVSGFENEIQTKTGELRNVAWSNLMTKDVHGNVVDVTCLGIDLTQRYQVEESLRLSNENFFTVLNSIDATVYVADMETHEILFCNKHMMESFGRDMTGNLCYQVFRGETRPCVDCTNDKLVDDNGVPTGVHVWDARNAITQRWYINYDRAITWTDKRVVKLQIATDITDLKNAYRTIQKMSVTDDLTRIYNRRHFHIRLNEEIQRALRYKHPLSIILMDIDHFKRINDEYGHQVGDEVLIAVAAILKSNVRTVDIVARYGGEEFVVILPETDGKAAVKSGEKLRKLIEMHTFKNRVDQPKINITACFGISSLSQLPTEIADMSHQIVKQADTALYTAKKDGRNAVILFSTDG